MDVAQFLQPADDKRLEQDQGHFLGQTALAEFQFRAYDDDRTSGIIDAFAQQVLTETPALAFEHVAEGFQRTVARASDRAAVTSVVEQCVHGFLQHAFLIANDHVWRL